MPAYSGADGNGDRTIDEHDYGVWRAHFGQSVPPLGAGSGVSSATASAAPVASVDESAVAGTSMSLSVSDPNQSGEPLGTSGTEQGVSQREIPLPLLAPASLSLAPYRSPVRRSLGTQRTFHASRDDEALVAWLASQPDTKKQFYDYDAAETWASEGVRDADDVHIDSVERVFAQLASNLFA